MAGSLVDPAAYAPIARAAAEAGFVSYAVGLPRRGDRRTRAGRGTSHPCDVDLSALTVPVTKIVGTRDGLASREELEANSDPATGRRASRRRCSAPP